MFPEDQGIAAQLKKPGPITRAVQSAGIAALPPTDPDTDARKTYSPGYGDAFANRGSSFAPQGPSNGPDSHALDTVSAIAKTGAVPAAGILDGIAPNPSSDAVPKPENRQVGGEHAPPLQERGVGIAAAPGPITAETANAAMGAPMQRAGGIAGSIDMKGVNDTLERENKARGELIDLSIKANGGNGIAVLPDRTEAENAEKTERWRQDELLGKMQGVGRSGAAAIGQALATSIAGQNQIRAEELRQQGATEQRGITAGIERDKMAGVDQRAAERNQVALRGQDVTASTAADRLASQERIATQRNESTDTRLTLPQRRSNFEIDAARERVAGLSPEEIKRKTANYTATGRENPDFDPTLAKAVSLANRRKYGADDHFDQREQAQQPAGNDGDVVTRFRADTGMKGHKTGQMTDQGLEVFDASGKLIGHYR